MFIFLRQARKWKRSTRLLTVKQIRTKFHNADNNGDGRLNKREFTKFLKDFGIKPSESDIESMMLKFDVDGGT